MKVPVELKIKYLSRRIQDIERLRSSLEQGDYSFAQKLGHQVKGNAVTFDVPQIAQLGHEMERAALKKEYLNDHSGRGCRRRRDACERYY